MIAKSESLQPIIKEYKDKFEKKIHATGTGKSDLLMDVFHIVPATKQTNPQYWGSELGRCWEKLLVQIFKEKCPDFAEPLKIGNDTPFDFFNGKDAIDTKYRIGSGNSGTLKKFKTNGEEFMNLGYRPIVLILREDNLASAISAFKEGGWIVYTGQDTFDYIQKSTGFDLEIWLKSLVASESMKITP